MNTLTLSALAEPHRLRIVELLRCGPLPVNEIGGRLDLKQPQASQHLKVLRDAGLVAIERRAQQRFYGLRGEPLRQLHQWLERYRDCWEARFEQLDEVVETLMQEEASHDR